MLFFQEEERSKTATKKGALKTDGQTDKGTHKVVTQSVNIFLIDQTLGKITYSLIICLFSVLNASMTTWTMSATIPNKDMLNLSDKSEQEGRTTGRKWTNNHNFKMVIFQIKE